MTLNLAISVATYKMYLMILIGQLVKQTLPAGEQDHLMIIHTELNSVSKAFRYSYKNKTAQLMEDTKK